MQKRYCEKCGLLMNAVKISNGFDRYTGEEIINTRYTCPELDWEKMISDERFSVHSTTFMGHYYFTEKE